MIFKDSSLSSHHKLCFFYLLIQREEEKSIHPLIESNQSIPSSLQWNTGDGRTRRRKKRGKRSKEASTVLFLFLTLIQRWKSTKKQTKVTHVYYAVETILYRPPTLATILRLFNNLLNNLAEWIFNLMPASVRTKEKS